MDLKACFDGKQMGDGLRHHGLGLLLSAVSRAQPQKWTRRFRIHPSTAAMNEAEEAELISVCILFLQQKRLKAPC